MLPRNAPLSALRRRLSLLHGKGRYGDSQTATFLPFVAHRQRIQTARSTAATLPPLEFLPVSKLAAQFAR